jgi:hypothetical protein
MSCFGTIGNFLRAAQDGNPQWNTMEDYQREIFGTFKDLRKDSATCPNCREEFKRNN